MTATDWTTPPTLAHLTPEEARERAERFAASLATRRTIRSFSRDPVPDGVLEASIRAAATAPNGANLQPWHFVIIRAAETKRAIREAAEAEERTFYRDRAPAEWLDTLRPLGTDERKPFLETAPALIAIFGQQWRHTRDGGRASNYYVKESVGIATGLLIAALHEAGLATLTHTPSPMGFLNRILERPANEKPFLLLVVGYPAPDARVPKIAKKAFGEIVSEK